MFIDKTRGLLNHCQKNPRVMASYQGGPQAGPLKTDFRPFWGRGRGASAEKKIFGLNEGGGDNST